MREIKFRYWNFITKKMEITYSIDFINAYGAMQYIGLKDKNGKEIWEGDIVELDGYNYKIEYYKNKFVLTGFYKTLSITIDPEEEDAIELITVIGNIYETPELLK
ncbi:MAG: YopX family protein [Nitrosotalea sp.]